MFFIIYIHLLCFPFQEKKTTTTNTYDIGIFDAETTKEDLIKQFGKQHIQQDTIFFEEEYYEIGTKIFPGTKNVLSITWKDTIHWSRPKMITISNPGSQWQFSNGIRIGIDLELLENLNQSPFIFLGFGWGFSGNIVNWNHGYLETYFSKYQNAHLFLEPDSYKTNIPLEFGGDKEIKSSNSSIKPLHLIVGQIRIIF